MTNPNHDEKNPRDPKGGGGSQLNPLRDHVQGEPEGGAPGGADAAAKPTPPAPPPAAPPPAAHNDPKKR